MLIKKIFHDCYLGINKLLFTIKQHFILIVLITIVGFVIGTYVEKYRIKYIKLYSGYATIEISKLDHFVNKVIFDDIAVALFDNYQIPSKFLNNQKNNLKSELKNFNLNFTNTNLNDSFFYGGEIFDNCKLDSARPLHESFQISLDLPTNPNLIIFKNQNTTSDAINDCYKYFKKFLKKKRIELLKKENLKIEKYLKELNELKIFFKEALNDLDKNAEKIFFVYNFLVSNSYVDIKNLNEAFLNKVEKNKLENIKNLKNNLKIIEKEKQFNSYVDQIVHYKLQTYFYNKVCDTIIDPRTIFSSISSEKISNFLKKEINNFCLEEITISEIFNHKFLGENYLKYELAENFVFDDFFIKKNLINKIQYIDHSLNIAKNFYDILLEKNNLSNFEKFSELKINKISTPKSYIPIAFTLLFFFFSLFIIFYFKFLNANDLRK